MQNLLTVAYESSSMYYLMAIGYTIHTISKSGAVTLTKADASGVKGGAR